MGWLYSQHESVKELHRSILQDYGDNVVDYKSTAFGRRLWVALKSHRDPSKVLIVEFMCNSYVDYGTTWWGYKPVDEGMGPVDVDCPLSLIEQCTEPVNEYAEKWRERVRAHHGKKKAKNVDWSEGDIVEAQWGARYRLRYKRKRSWIVRKLEDGRTYRIGPGSFGEYKVVEKGVKDATV